MLTLLPLAGVVSLLLMTSSPRHAAHLNGVIAIAGMSLMTYLFFGIPLLLTLGFASPFIFCMLRIRSRPIAWLVAFVLGFAVGVFFQDTFIQFQAEELKIPARATTSILGGISTVWLEIAWRRYARWVEPD